MGRFDILTPPWPSKAFISSHHLLQGHLLWSSIARLEMRIGLGNLPPALLVFIHFEILFWLNAVTTTTIVVNAQQCHLVLNGGGNDGMLNPPTNGGNSIPINGSHTATTSSTTRPGDSEATRTSTTSRSGGGSSTTTSSSTPTPTVQPFDYENDKIRGVNL